ncbi:DUF2922 domain-containing protein [Natranaerofaba carboxydovora]|uniref:DUF2922 domain-containing protein n=1 Tax=Natranaerofaba carboxydovora TaxID=2742683 RepID=UPI001F129655|nr:DUF2922 domain-containing protein [Natranaerofaba carboxydovora]UMZ74663.1 hypothetical protein ACONDI_02262 [Natranaerofaba carboxydovora]
MIREYLQMSFRNLEGGNFTLSVYDPKEDLTSEEVEAVMNNILEKNSFKSPGGDLKSKSAARIVTRQVNTLAEF